MELRAEPSHRQVLLIVPMEAGEAESTDCVYRHILFITRSGYSAEADRLRAHHASAPSPATANQDSYVGVAGQKVILRKHDQQLLAPVAGLRSTGRQVWGREEQHCSIVFHLVPHGPGRFH